MRPFFLTFLILTFLVSAVGADENEAETDTTEPPTDLNQLTYRLDCQAMDGRVISCLEIRNAIQEAGWHLTGQPKKRGKKKEPEVTWSQHVIKVGVDNRLIQLSVDVGCEAPEGRPYKTDDVSSPRGDTIDANSTTSNKDRIQAINTLIARLLANFSSQKLKFPRCN